MARPRGIKQPNPNRLLRNAVQPLTVVSVSSASTGVKISELPAASAANATDQMEVNQGGVSKRLTVEQIGSVALLDATIPIDGEGHIHFLEDGGQDVASPYGAPMWFDMSDLSNNNKHGISFDVRTTDDSTTINSNAIAVDIYTPPDNGGDVSGIYVRQTGGGNALSVFNLGEFRPGGLTNYPTSGFAIEAQTDFSKTAIYASADDGVSFSAMMRGDGPGLLIAAIDDTGPGRHALKIFADAGQTVPGLFARLDGHLGIGIDPGDVEFYLSVPDAAPGAPFIINAPNMPNGNSVTMRIGTDIGTTNKNVNLIYTQDATASSFEIIHFGDAGGGVKVTKGAGLTVPSMTVSGTPALTIGALGGAGMGGDGTNVGIRGYASGGLYFQSAGGAVTYAFATSTDFTFSIPAFFAKYFRTGAPVIETNPTHTVTDTENYIVANRAGTVTVTLPSAAAQTGRVIRFKTYQAQTIISASSNVIPRAGGAATTAIVPATIGAWADVVAGTTNWELMAGTP
jgi:hypothetical protein